MKYRIYALILMGITTSVGVYSQVRFEKAVEKTNANGGRENFAKTTNGCWKNAFSSKSEHNIEWSGTCDEKGFISGEGTLVDISRRGKHMEIFYVVRPYKSGAPSGGNDIFSYNFATNQDFGFTGVARSRLDLRSMQVLYEPVSFDQIPEEMLNAIKKFPVLSAALSAQTGRQIANTGSVGGEVKAGQRCLKVNLLPAGTSTFDSGKAKFSIENTCDEDVAAHLNVRTAGDSWPSSVRWGGTHVGSQSYNPLWSKGTLPDLPFKPQLSSPDTQAPILPARSFYTAEADLGPNFIRGKSSIQYKYYYCPLYSGSGRDRVPVVMFYAGDGSAAACIPDPQGK